MNNLAILNPPESVEIITGMNYDNTTFTKKYVSFYPYRSMHWEEAVSKFGISLPKTIITLGDGVTTCGKCGAKYSGSQSYCTNLIWKYECESNYRNDVVEGHGFVGDKHISGYYRDRAQNIVKTFKHPCGVSYDLKWNLREEFSFQESFFDMLSHLSTMENKDNSDLASFQDFIPHSKYDMIDMNMMRNRVRELERQNVQMVEIIKQIANRMSQAGSALNIGNL